MEQLKITRLPEWANRRFRYKIFIDDKEQFELENGQERLLTIDNGATLQAKLLWCGSEKIKLVANNGQIKELRVKANKGPNIRFPFFALTVLIVCSIITLVYPNNGWKDAMISIIAGVIIYALALVTIWRNKFLEIEVVKD